MYCVNNRYANIVRKEAPWSGALAYWSRLRFSFLSILAYPVVGAPRHGNKYTSYKNGNYEYKTYNPSLMTDYRFISVHLGSCTLAIHAIIVARVCIAYGTPLSSVSRPSRALFLSLWPVSPRVFHPGLGES